MKKKQSLPIQQRLEDARLKTLVAFETRARKRGFQKIAGVDEAGRGPLAGPVVAAACIIPEGIYLPGINDSKKLTSEQRERLYDLLKSNPEILSAEGVVEAIIIDQINILRATLEAMAVAIVKLKAKPDYVLVDGNRLPSLEMPAEAIVRGDSLSQSIMAAAIIAKVTRDKMMKQYHEQWPEYGFDEHKGYPTPQHLQALEKFGACPIHRQSFGPVKMTTHKG